MGTFITYSQLPRPLSKSSTTFKTNQKKLKSICKAIFGLTESFKTMNRSDPTQPTRNALKRLFLKKFKRYGPEILTQSSFKTSSRAIIIYDRHL